MAADVQMHWQTAVRRALVALAAAMLCGLLPLGDWLPGWAQPLHLPLVIFVLVCFLGKLLYDTLFYDRYRP